MENTSKLRYVQVEEGTEVPGTMYIVTEVYEGHECDVHYVNGTAMKQHMSQYDVDVYFVD